MKTCNCCGAKHTESEFLALPLPASGKGTRVTEYQSEVWRNCNCGSTLMVVTEVYDNE